MTTPEATTIKTRPINGQIRIVGATSFMLIVQMRFLHRVESSYNSRNQRQGASQVALASQEQSKMLAQWRKPSGSLRKAFTMFLVKARLPAATALRFTDDLILRSTFERSHLLQTSQHYTVAAAKP